jgi:hypothetical protein
MSATGPGILAATTLFKAAIAGVATFNDLKFDTSGSYLLKADSSTFTQISTPITVVDPIAKWTFEGVGTTNTGTTVNVSAGSAIADAGIQTAGSSFTAVHSNSSTVWSNVAGNGSIKSVSANNWSIGDYFQFKISTTGYTAIKLLYDQTGSNTGPRDFKLQYSTTIGGASGYTDFGTAYAVPQTAAPAAIGWSSTATSATSLSTLSFDLSSITALNGKSEVYFRIVITSTVSLQNGVIATTGTGRVDNFTVLAEACPTLNAGSNGTLVICAGSTVTTAQLFAQLGSSPQSGGTWTPTLAGAGTYTYTVAATSPCSGSASSQVVVTDQAQPNAGTNGSLTICAGSTVTTSQLFAQLGSSPDSVGSWTPTLAGAGTYTYTVNATAPCTLAATAQIVVTELALPVVMAGDVSGCSGMPIPLTGSATPMGGSGIYSVANPYVGSSSTTYTYSYTAPNGCSATSSSANITVTPQPLWYLDSDNDGYYTGVGIASCTSPGTGYTTATLLGGGDCDDSNAAINPGATEICYNNIDDNCNGLKSEGCAAVVVNMTPSYNNTTLVSLATAVPAVPYTYTGSTNLKYRFSITNVTTGVTAADIIQISRFVTIPQALHLYGATYTIKASAVINDEVVAYAGNTITVFAPTIQTVTLSAASCGATLASLSSTISANAGLNATGYTFRIRLNDTNATPTYGYSNSATRFVGVNTFTGFPLQYATSYKIAVQYTFTDPVTLSPVLSGYGAECVVNTPSIPVTRLSSPTCGSQVASFGSSISAAPGAYATAYQFRARLVGDTTYYTTTPNASRFSSLSAFGVQFAYNTSYLVSVQYSIVSNSVTLWSGYEPECSIITPFFPTTQLVQNQCGLATPTSLTQTLNIIPYPGFPSYKVKLDEISGESITNSQEIIISYANFKLSDFSIAQVGKNYNVSVAIKQGLLFGDYSTACDMFTAPLARMIKLPFKATAYPNPFANNFMLAVTTSSKSTVSVKVYDMLGRLIEQREVGLNDLETTTIGDGYPSGVYNVVVAQEDSIETVRVVKR